MKLISRDGKLFFNFLLWKGDRNFKSIKVAKIKILIMPTVEDVELLEPSYTAGGSIKWYNRFEELFGSFL